MCDMILTGNKFSKSAFGKPAKVKKVNSCGPCSQVKSKNVLGIFGKRE
jgi:hypothetical protein